MTFKKIAAVFVLVTIAVLPASATVMGTQKPPVPWSITQ